MSSVYIVKRDTRRVDSGEAPPGEDLMHGRATNTHRARNRALSQSPDMGANDLQVALGSRYAQLRLKALHLLRRRREMCLAHERLR